MVIIPDLIWNGFTMNGREDLAIEQVQLITRLHPEEMAEDGTFTTIADKYGLTDSVCLGKQR